MRRWRMLVMVGVAAVLAAAVVIVVRSGGETPERPAAKPGPSDPPAPVPADPKRERWRWDSKVVLADMMAAGHGVVAVDKAGGFVGIDGCTGKQLWKRRGGKNLPGRTPELEVTPRR